MVDFNGIDMSNLDLSQMNRAIASIKVPPIHFDGKNTVQYKIQEQTEQLSKNQQEQIKILKKQLQKSEKQIELLEKNNNDNTRQIRLLNEQVEQLLQNYNALKDLYNAKDAELKAAEKDAKNSKRFNWISLGVALVSLLVAIGAWVFPR